MEVSGFKRDELIGQPHNIVRHPDMPAEAYENMWSHLKAGRPWMGLVKNRCKNGDYYWVSAYVTPVTQAGKIVGYESVRSCPSREDVDRAQKLYANIQNGSSAAPFWMKVTPSTFFLVALFVTTALLFLFDFRTSAEVALALGVVIYAVWTQQAKKRLMSSITALLGKAFTDDLAARSYTDDDLQLGRVKVAVLAQQAHLDAVLTRIEDAAGSVKIRAVEGLEATYEAQETLRRQQAETEQVAAAVHEMSQTIGEVSANVQQTADKAEGARSSQIKVPLW